MNNKPKVAIVTPGSFPIPSPSSSSVETVVYTIANNLKNNIDFTILGKKSKELPYQEQSNDISFIRFRFKNWKTYINKVINHLITLNPHIIQIENRPKYIPYLKEHFQDTPLILSLHSTNFISRSRISNEQLRHCINLCTKIIVNSQFLKNHLIDKTGCAEDKVFVNHLGVDVNQFKSKWNIKDKAMEEDTIRQSLGIKDQHVLLYVGRLRKMKGVHKLLEAFPYIIESNPNTILIIAGSAFYGTNRITGYVQKLTEKAKQFPDQIKFIPFIPHDEIHRWFKIADIVLVPSITKEAFGLVNVEAMATGVPVIATRIGGMPEIIQHGETGFLADKFNMEIELAAYVNQLLSDPIKINKMGENSIKRVHEHFTWEKCASRLNHLYKEINCTFEIK
ncbi:glycosyltransferase family 4 protein [Bacillus dakarensis]|uniref:glycosyltransferase family 4 protein n=1 Tax=Robertmurraya dakarensis TaxID=1926278 RepID=UPI0009815F8C|nr:glycosyltransferase family 4 protein [Bacillus dakarensis]